MVENKSLEINENITELFKITQIEAPTAVARVISPVVEVGKRTIMTAHKSHNGLAAGAGIFTTSATRKTFITGVELASASTAANTTEEIFVVTTQNGATSTYLAYLVRKTGAISNQSVYIDLSDNPFVPDKNVLVTLTNGAGAVGDILSKATIYYYEQDEV